MLVRRTADNHRLCIHQEHHALLSGLLAAEWHRRLPGALIGAITLHDNPWRAPDSTPRFDPDDSDIVDFVCYPKSARLEFYAQGIDELEEIDAYTAYMVSLHYTSFAGTTDLEAFQASERDRRDHLRPKISFDDEALDEHLRWLRFFDVFSLYLCLTGPGVNDEAVPVWLRDPGAWTTSPDDVTYEIDWTAPFDLRIEPWPFFGEHFEFDLYGKTIARPQSEAELAASWDSTVWTTRTLSLRR